MKQLTLAMAGFERYAKTTRRAVFLAEMERVVPWSALCALIEPFYPKPGNGRPPVGVERMLRIYFLQHWSSGPKTAPNPKCGHVFCSFLALLLQKRLDDLALTAGVTLEWKTLLRDLDRLQQLHIRHRQADWLVRTDAALTRGGGVVPRPPEFRQKRRNINGLLKQGVQVGSNSSAPSLPVTAKLPQISSLPSTSLPLSSGSIDNTR
jgi:hypothetical protein